MIDAETERLERLHWRAGLRAPCILFFQRCRADRRRGRSRQRSKNHWDLFERRLIGAIGGPEDVDIEMVAALAADAFLTLYGVDEDRPAEKAPKPN